MPLIAAAEVPTALITAGELRTGSVIQRAPTTVQQADLRDLGIVSIGHRRLLLDAIALLSGSSGPADSRNRSARRRPCTWR